MRFVDDLYALYKERLTGDENEAIALVINILSEQKKEDLIKLIHQMSEDEIKQMLSLYMVELLKARMEKDGLLEQSHHTQNTPYH